MSTLVVGSIAFDHVETPHGKDENALGGAALYFANAASFFTEVNLVGVVGKDFNIDDIAYLKDRNVNMDGLEVADGKTFRWGGCYHRNMNHRDTIFTELNVFGEFKPKIPAHYKESEFVFLANIQPDLQADVLSQVSQAKCVVLDTMNLWISNERASLLDLMKRVDILIINDEEVKELAATDSLIEASRVIRSMGPKISIVKKGEHGAIMFYNDRIFAIPAFPLETVYDPTGAGDTFAGGFVGYISKMNDFNEANLRKAIIYGSIMASFVCEDFSFKRLKNLKEREIEQRYKEFQKLVEF